MPFLLHKLLPLGVLPIGFTLLMLLLALIFRKRWMMGAALGVLYLSSTNVVSEPLIQTLENRYPRVEPAAVPQVDAVVVLGGILRERLDGIEWADGVDRFTQGVALVKAGKAPRLVFTGARLPWFTQRETEGEELRKEAVARGIPPGAVFVTGEVTVTAQESQAVAELARNQGWKSLILVTSAFHMPRSMRLFQGVVPTVIAFPTDYRSRTGVSTGIMDFVPQAQAILVSEAALREYWGLLYYSVRRRP